MYRSIGYSVTVGERSTADRTAVYRASTHPDSLVENALLNPYESMWSCFRASAEEHSERNCLGRRTVNEDGCLGDYTWLSYAEVRKHVEAMASQLSKMIKVENFPDETYGPGQTLRPVGISATNSVEWIIAEMAIYASNSTLIPFYDALADDQIIHILKQTRVRCLFLGIESIPTFIEILMRDSSLPVRTIVCMKQEMPDKYAHLVQSWIARGEGRQFRHYWDVVKQGDNEPIVFAPPKKENVALICYTSGTTGDPKGVQLSHGGIVAVMMGCLRGPMADTSMLITHDEVYLSYLPLAHVLERTLCGLAICKGAAIGVYSGDLRQIPDDIATLRPTVFVGVPRVFYKIHDEIMKKVRASNKFVSRLFERGIQAKVARMQKTGSVKHVLWDSLVFNKVKAGFGGRLRYMMVGGAPMDSAVQMRVQAMFSAPLVIGYGLTETTGPSHCSVPGDPVPGTIGGPLPCSEFCFRSVPEMDYLVSDDPPAGELLLKATGLFKGYFRNAELTRQCFSDDGWFCTGDIGVLLPNGSVKVIDRKKNIFKLSQGEYVAPERLECVYTKSELVAQMCVYGSSVETCLVAVVVPEDAALHGFLAQSKKGLKKLEDAILEDFARLAAEAKVKGFERIKAVKVVTEPFTIENHLLTPTMKLVRHALVKKYAKEIAEMYDGIREKAKFSSK